MSDARVATLRGLMLQRIDDDLWCAAAPMSFLGLRVGTRMTIAKLADGSVWIHSPIAPSDGLCEAVEAIGPVRHLVAPNLYHHVFVGEWKRRYPEATLHAPQSLAKKRPDLTLDAHLSEQPHPSWKDHFEPLHIDGSMMDETVFLHRRSRTLISSDLIENFASSDHLPTRLYLKAGGIYGRIGWHRALRVVYRDRAAAWQSVERLLSRDFDRVVLAHGELVDRGGRDAVRKTFDFLR